MIWNPSQHSGWREECCAVWAGQESCYSLSDCHTLLTVMSLFRFVFCLFVLFVCFVFLFVFCVFVFF